MNYKRKKPGRKTTACRCCHWGSTGNSKKPGARNPKFLTVTKAARKKLAESLLQSIPDGCYAEREPGYWTRSFRDYD